MQGYGATRSETRLNSLPYRHTVSRYLDVQNNISIPLARKLLSIMPIMHWKRPVKQPKQASKIILPGQSILKTKAQAPMNGSSNSINNRKTSTDFAKY